ncbi:MAG: zf-HC2 domain-containing protein [Gemmatimonadota bacterium]
MSDEGLEGQMIPPGPADELHLSAEQLTAFVDRALSASERSSVAAHLAECPPCRRELAEVIQALRERRNLRRRAVGIPTAAAAAAAILIFVYIPKPGPGPTPSTLRTDRAVAEETGVPALVPLAPGATASAESVEFIWRAAADGVVYRVTLADERGEVVWTDETSDTTARVPPGVSLERGQTYFWYVDALLGGAGSATTGVQEFRVQE